MSTVKSNLERKRPWGMATEHAGYFGTSDYRASLLKFGKPYVVVTAVIFLVSTMGADGIDWPVYLLGWGLALASLGFSYTHPLALDGRPLRSAGGSGPGPRGD